MDSDEFGEWSRRCEAGNGVDGVAREAPTLPTIEEGATGSDVEAGRAEWRFRLLLFDGPALDLRSGKDVDVDGSEREALRLRAGTGIAGDGNGTMGIKELGWWCWLLRWLGFARELGRRGGGLMERSRGWCGGGEDTRIGDVEDARVFRLRKS